MGLIEVKKVKTEWRAVEFDGSQGSESFDDVLELLDWSRASGVINCLDEYSPNIAVPEKKPTYPGETLAVYVKHGDYIVASNRGKVKVVDRVEFYEQFSPKE